MSKNATRRIREFNNEWSGNEHTIERERTLFRLVRIENYSQNQGYFGSDNCYLCDMSIPYGSRQYCGCEWPISIQHFIEFHGHKPNDLELQAIEANYNEIRVRNEGQVKTGEMRNAFKK